MHKNLLNGLALTMLLSACGGATPHITVVCEENSVGNSIVKWETKPALEGDVKVFASTDPEDIPEIRPVATANIADQWTTVVSNDPTRRHYYTLLFNDKYRVRVATRNVNVPGVQNFRDLGGYPVYARHKQVRWGMLYRSAQIDLTQPATLDKLNNLGIRTLIDLRDTAEYPRTTDSLPGQPRVVHIPIHAGNLADILAGIDRESIQSDTVYRIVERINRHIVTVHASDFRRMFDTLLDEDNYPAVICCTTGKGRTGVVAALIFSALGVDEETIMDDYRLSNNYFDIASASQQAYSLPVPYQEAITTLYSAHTEFLNAAKDAAECSYGDVGTYLRKGIGLTKDETRELRGILLEERGL